MAPRKRPLSNMCPVIAMRDGAPWLALGASGGRRILPAVLQIGSMLADCGLDLESAIHRRGSTSPAVAVVLADRRWHRTCWPSFATRFAVREVEQVVLPKLFACPTAVLRDPGTGEAIGMTDPMQPVAGVACPP